MLDLPRHQRVFWGIDHLARLRLDFRGSEGHFFDIPDRFCTAEALGCVVTSYHALKGPTGFPITERSYHGRPAARTLRGGPAPAESLRQADLFARGLADDEGSVATIEARLAEAARKLEAAIDRLIG